MFRSKLIALFLALMTVVGLTACRTKIPSPAEIVGKLTENEPSLPMGKTYYSDAVKDSGEHLSAELLHSAYGIPEDFDGIISAAVYLSSFGFPCEFAVFYCKSRAAAEDVALFCRERIDTVTQNAPEASSFGSVKLEDYLSYLKNSAVIISGRIVALIISADEASARRALYKAI